MHIRGSNRTKQTTRNLNGQLLLIGKLASADELQSCISLIWEKEELWERMLHTVLMQPIQKGSVFCGFSNVSDRKFSKSALQTDFRGDFHWVSYVQ